MATRQTRSWRDRTAAVLAVLSVVLMSGGLVMMSAPAASAHGHDDAACGTPAVPAVTHVVTDKDAYDETVVDRPAYDESVHHDAVTHVVQHAAVPAVTHTETLWSNPPGQGNDGNPGQGAEQGHEERWVTDGDPVPGGPADSPGAWHPIDHRTVTDVPAVPASEETVVDQEAYDEPVHHDAVTHVVQHAAVTHVVVDSPAVPAGPPCGENENENENENEKQVVVCKYVSTPDDGEHLDHIVIVDEHSLGGFTDTFPFGFSDAQGGSTAIRYAAEGEQAQDVSLSECTPVVPHDECAQLPGDQPVGFACTKDPDVTKIPSEGAPNCTTGQVELFETTTTTTYSFVDGAWVAGSPEVGQPVSTGFRDATQTECPAAENPTLVAPSLPSQTAATCTTAGSIVEPAETTGVSVAKTQLGSGKVRYDLTPAAGYTFGAGPQLVSKTVQALPRLSGAACPAVEGTEVVRPPEHPVKASQVKGSQVKGSQVKGSQVKGSQVKGSQVKGSQVKGSHAQVLGTEAVREAAVAPARTAVPTSVEAGLAGPSPTDGRVLVGQALLGAGLLLLVAAGWSGPRRRV